jgi:hypothetical protein
MRIFPTILLWWVSYISISCNWKYQHGISGFPVTSEVSELSMVPCLHAHPAHAVGTGWLVTSCPKQLSYCSLVVTGNSRSRPKPIRQSSWSVLSVHGDSASLDIYQVPPAFVTQRLQRTGFQWAFAFSPISEVYGKMCMLLPVPWGTRSGVTGCWLNFYQKVFCFLLHKVCISPYHTIMQVLTRYR